MIGYRFKAKLQRPDDGGAAIFFEVPSKVMRALGPRKRVPVRVVVNGHEWRTTIAIYAGKPLVGFNAVVRAATRAKAGAVVGATLQLDETPRDIPVPKDLATALRAAALLLSFKALSLSHRREHIRAIEDAKRPETRAARIKKCVEMLRRSN